MRATALFNCIFHRQPNQLLISLFSVCFKVFDADRDGKLSRSEVQVMIRCMKEVSQQSGNDHDDEVSTGENAETN